MLLFSSPYLLTALPLIALLGLWALWRGKKHPHPIPSTKLWTNLASQSAGARTRTLDPLWLLIFLAALLAALALPNPQWQPAPDPSSLPSAKIQAAARSLDASPPKLFLRFQNPRNLQTPLTLEYLADNNPSTAQPLNTPDLLHGLTLETPFAPDIRQFSIRIHSANTLLAQATFTRPDWPPFALLTRTAQGRQIDPALYKLFAVNPSARPQDPRIHPAVLLLDDPRFTPEDLANIDPDTLIIAAPDTPLPAFRPPAPPSLTPL